MLNKKFTDKELMETLKVDAKTLGRFKQIRQETIKEAESMASKTKKKIKILGISGSARDEFDMAQESSNSEELLKVCLDHCKKLGADIELIPLRKYDIKPCKACYSTVNTQCHFYCSCYPKGTPAGDDMSNILYDKVLDADAIIFATPINHFGISSYTKLFIDRCISLDGALPPADPKNPKNKELNIKHMKFIELTADNNIIGSGLLKRFLGKVAGVIVTGHEVGASMVISNLFMTLNNDFEMIFPPSTNFYALSSPTKSTYEDKPIVTSEYYRAQARIAAQNIVFATKQLANKKFKWVYEQSTD